MLRRLLTILGALLTLDHDTDLHASYECGD
jgi:hypothetical protein